MLYAANEPLYNSIVDKLEHMSISNISKLINYGVYLGDSVVEYLINSAIDHIDVEKRVGFIATLSPTMDMHEVDTLIDYLKMIETDLVVLGPTAFRKHVDKQNIKNSIIENKIDFVWLDNRTKNYVPDIKYKTPVYMNFGLSCDTHTHEYVKHIALVNNKPIQL
jgi:hypothetical protein